MINSTYTYFMEFDLGPCCACQKTGASVRNIVSLPFIASQPGTGWGCVACELPADGALAVVCDHCLETHAPLRFATDGFAVDKGRVPIETLTEPYKHDLSRHKDQSQVEPKTMKAFKKQRNRR